MSVYPPNFFLYPLQWYLYKMRVYRAWHQLRLHSENQNHAFGTPNDITYGSANIIIGFQDIDSLESTPNPMPNNAPPQPSDVLEAAHPYLQGTVSNNRNKAYGFFDFSKFKYDHYNGAGDSHFLSSVGTVCSYPRRPITPGGEMKEGMIGVAPNVRFVAVNLGDHLAIRQNGYLYLAGLFSDPNGPPSVPLDPGVDIINNSTGENFGPHLNRVIDEVVNFGRRGRGVLNFQSAGNEGTEINIIQAMYKKSFAIGSTTLFVDGQNRDLVEMRANYSSYGRALDFVACSGSKTNAQAPYHNSPDSIKMTNLAYTQEMLHPDNNLKLGLGNYHGGFGLEAVRITTQIAPGESVIYVAAEDVQHFEVGKAMMIGLPTDQDPNYDPFELGFISVDTFQSRRIEEIEVLDNGQGEITFESAFLRPALNPLVYFGDSYVNIAYGGASFGGPVVAGIAALMLSAKPSLTWREVRELLRLTAEKIDYRTRPNPPLGGKGLWRNAAGELVFQPNGEPILERNCTSGIRDGFEVTDRFIALAEPEKFQVGQVITIHREGEEDQREVRWIKAIHLYSITVDNLEQEYPDPGAVTVKGGKVLYHSEFYGHGRVDAEKAVEAAFNYDHAHRDLMIRDHFQDHGEVPSDLNDPQPIHSPDIWLTAAKVEDPQQLNDGLDAPHQSPMVDGSSNVMVDVDNSQITGLDLQAISGNYIGGEGTQEEPVQYELRVTGVRLPRGPQFQILADYGEDNSINNDNKISDIVEVRRGGELLKSIIVIPEEFIEIDRGIRVRFAAKVGHNLDDFWIIKAWANTNYVQARIRNRGNGGDNRVRPLKNLEAEVRFSLRWVADGEIPFRFPEHYRGKELYDPDNLVQPNIPATYFIGEVEVARDEIGPRQIYNVALPWNTSWAHEGLLNNFDTGEAPMTLNPFILTHIAPLDGPEIGESTRDCNNLSYREIIFSEVRFLAEAGDEAPNSVFRFPDPEVEVLQPFRIAVRTTVGQFDVGQLQVRALKRTTDGLEEVAIFELIGVDWPLPNNEPDWVSIGQPIDPLSANPALGDQIQVVLTGEVKMTHKTDFIDVSVVIRSTFSQVELAVETFRFDHTLPGELPEYTPGLRDILPRSHVFADMTTLQQPIELAYGPAMENDGENRENIFRTTSGFTSPVDVRTYAVTDGFVMVQPMLNDEERVNLILQPYRPAISGVFPVKYFIYRGLKRSDFMRQVDGDWLVVEQQNASEFILEQYIAHNRINQGRPFFARDLGFDPDAQPGNHRLDHYFSPIGNRGQLPYVDRGTFLGHYFGGENRNFGFEIVLEESSYSPSMGFARWPLAEIDLRDMEENTEAEIFAKRIKREDVLNFLDPAAYYGLHNKLLGWVEVRQEEEGEQVTVKKTGQLIYEEILVHFLTRNNLYVDLRNENGRSLNFYRNYQEFSWGIDIQNMQTGSYGTHQWPIHIFQSGQDISQDFNRFHFQLNAADNLSPVVFIEHGNLITPDSFAGFIRELPLQGGKTETMTFAVPNLFNEESDNPERINQAWQVKGHFSRKLNEATEWPGTVVESNHYTDNIFGPIDTTERWLAENSVRWQRIGGKDFIENQGLKFMAEKGMGFDNLGNGRVVFFAFASDFLDKDPSFSPKVGITNGSNVTESFLQESIFFGDLELQDGLTEDDELTLNLARNPPFAPDLRTIMLLGITREEFERLKAAEGLSREADRYLMLDLESEEDDYTVYSVKVQGLDPEGEYDCLPPEGDEVVVITRDGNSFFSVEFAELEPPR